MTLAAETEANFQKFFAAWTAEAAKNWASLHPSDKLLRSYRRIAAFQSLKMDLLAATSSPSVLAFFHEAHNDAFVSHVSASLGAWRPALQALRSFIENSLCGLYYSDHPIELRNWERGKRKIGFTDLVSYFEAHPDLSGIPQTIDGLAYLKEEYKTLSLAVHASAKAFRMSDDVGTILLWNDAQDRLSKWSTREGATLTGVALLTICLRKDLLTGTQRAGLRTVLSFVFGPNIRKALKGTLHVNVQLP